MKALRQFPPVRFRCASPPPFAEQQPAAYCNACGKHVYNLSVLSQAAQDALLAKVPAPCVRYRQAATAALPLVAAALLWSGTAPSQAQAGDVEKPHMDPDMDLLIVGGAIPRPPLASVFLEESPENRTSVDPQAEEPR